MPHCLICQAEFEPFLSLGKMPIANGFLMPEQFGEEYLFDMKVAHCQTCHMVQLVELAHEKKVHLIGPNCPGMMIPDKIKFIYLENSSGSIDVSGISSDLKINSKHGELNIENVKGDIDIKHSYGDITLIKIDGNISLDNSNRWKYLKS